MAKVSKTHNYVMQRNYAYETQHADSKHKGLTEEEWREKILEEWSWRNLKANYVVIIFHDKDKDKDTGEDKGLHAHGIGNFEQSLTQSEALKHSGCSSEDNCRPMKDKVKAYRYHLHITEKAIEDHKHIYSEDELIFSVADGKNFGLKEYHKVICKKNQQSEETKEDKKLIDETIKKILDAYYGDGYKRIVFECNGYTGVDGGEFDKQLIYDELIKDQNVVLAMGRNSQLYTKVMNTIKLRVDMTRVMIKDAREHGLDIDAIRCPENKMQENGQKARH